MSSLIHKVGLKLDLVSPVALHPNKKNGLEKKVQKKEGIIYAEFSKEHPDLFVVEYDPYVTKPDAIYKMIKHLNGSIKRKVYL